MRGGLEYVREASMAKRIGAAHVAGLATFRTKEKRAGRRITLLAEFTLYR